MSQSIEVVSGDAGWTIHAQHLCLSFWLDKSLGWNRQMVDAAVDMLREIDDRTCSLDYKSECEALQDEIDDLKDTIRDLRFEVQECRSGMETD